MLDFWHIAAVGMIAASIFSGCGEGAPTELSENTARATGLVMSGRGLRLDVELDDRVVVKCTADALLEGSHEKQMHLQGQTTLEITQVFHLEARSDELVVDLDRQTMALRGNVRAMFKAPQLLERINGENAPH